MSHCVLPSRVKNIDKSYRKSANQLPRTTPWPEPRTSLHLTYYIIVRTSHFQAFSSVPSIVQPNPSSRSRPSSNRTFPNLQQPVPCDATVSCYPRSSKCQIQDLDHIRSAPRVLCCEHRHVVVPSSAGRPRRLHHPRHPSDATSSRTSREASTPRHGTRRVRGEVCRLLEDVARSFLHTIDGLGDIREAGACVCVCYP